MSTFSHITDGVRVTVDTEFQSRFSIPDQLHYAFAYKVTIENGSVYTLQLLRRHWYIFDSNATVNEVEGEGVVGKQPIIEPGEIHQYISGCNLSTEIGMMTGTYTMSRIMDGRKLIVQIPKFQLIAPYRLN